MRNENRRKPEVGRGASRFATHLPATLHHEGRDFDCFAGDLSRTGVRLVGDMPIPVDADIRFTLRNSSGDLVVSLGGRLVRLEEDEEGRNSLAVEFEPPGDEARAILEALIARIVERGAPPEFQALPPRATPEQIREMLESLPVPHRITLAGRAAPREREILFHDPHPQVIDALARNPNLLPQEARALLRMPGLPCHTLEAMARDSRWGGKREFKILLATHPNTPPALAERLVSKMGERGLREVLRKPGLHPTVRYKLVRRIPGR